MNSGNHWGDDFHSANSRSPAGDIDSQESTSANETRDLDRAIAVGMKLPEDQRETYLQSLPPSLQESVAEIIRSDQLVQPETIPWTPRRVIGTVIMALGTIVMLALLMFLLDGTNWEGWVILLTSIAVASPLLILGGVLAYGQSSNWRETLRLKKAPQLTERERQSMEDGLSGMVLAGCMFVFLTGMIAYGWAAFAIGRHLPVGDDWFPVTIRIGYVATVFLLGRWFLVWTIERSRRWAIGRLSPRVVHTLYREDERPRPETGWQAIRQHAGLIVTWVLALLLATRTVDLRALDFDIPDVKKLRAFLLALRWARANPNTIIIASSLWAAYAGGRLAYELTRAEKLNHNRLWALVSAGLTIVVVVVIRIARN